MQWLVFWLLIISFPAVAAQAPGQADIGAVPGVEEAPPGGDFTLMSGNGSVSLADFRGKPVFLYFGYTKCPDVCPTSMAYLTNTLGQLSEDELKQVAAIFVSVDPKRDTPAQLKDYVEYFHPHFIGVTGTEQQISEVSARYGAKYYAVELEGSAFGYAINHSAAIYLIQPDGQIRFIFPHETPSSVMLEAVRYLLAGN